MAIATTPGTIRRYVLEKDRAPNVPDERRTVFLLAELSAKEADEVSQHLEIASQEGGNLLLRHTFRWAYELVRRALAGTAEDHPLWDADGNPIPFVPASESEKGRVAEEYLDRLERSDILELARAVNERLTVDEVGKSEPSPDGSEASSESTAPDPAGEPTATVPPTD